MSDHVGQEPVGQAPAGQPTMGTVTSDLPTPDAGTAPARPRYVWRVSGQWPPPSEIDEGYPPSVRVRHYLTERAARARAQAWLEGREYDDIEPDTNAPTVHVIPPAAAVTVERSAPVAFPPTGAAAASPTGVLDLEQLRTACQNTLAGRSVGSYIDPRAVLALLDQLAAAQGVACDLAAWDLVDVAPPETVETPEDYELAMNDAGALLHSVLTPTPTGGTTP